MSRSAARSRSRGVMISIHAIRRNVRSGVTGLVVGLIAFLALLGLFLYSPAGGPGVRVHGCTVRHVDLDAPAELVLRKTVPLSVRAKDIAAAHGHCRVRATLYIDDPEPHLIIGGHAAVEVDLASEPLTWNLTAIGERDQATALHVVVEAAEQCTLHDRCETFSDSRVIRVRRSDAQVKAQRALKEFADAIRVHAQTSSGIPPNIPTAVHVSVESKLRIADAGVDDITISVRSTNVPAADTDEPAQMDLTGNRETVEFLLQVTPPRARDFTPRIGFVVGGNWQGLPLEPEDEPREVRFNVREESVMKRLVIDNVGWISAFIAAVSGLILVVRKARRREESSDSESEA